MSRVGLARQLRRNQTDAERVLWFYVRDRRLNGLKFRRQVPIGPYIVDFCCEAARLIVELDGGQHAARAAQDAIRTADLEARGYLVLRYWDNGVIRNIDGVLDTILLPAGATNPPHPNPLPSGEREHRGICGPASVRDISGAGEALTVGLGFAQRRIGRDV